MKKLFLLLLAGLLFFGIIFSYRFYIDSLYFSKNPDSDRRVIVEVEKGNSAATVADILYEKGLIRSPWVFKLYLRQNDLADKIKAGRIVIMENENLKSIADALVTGRGDEVAVTLLEGWTIRQMAEYLESFGVTQADAFLKCAQECVFDFDFLPKGYLEGYLYPDTYFVSLKAYSDKSFIARLIQNLQNRLTSADEADLKKSPYSFEQIMIMASIIEREERDPEERPVVAGILWDRLDNKVGLGADATILYALGRTKGELSYNDLQTDSPYNTRKYRGLPPTPICNPSISSIRAAISPKRTEFFYYLHDEEGQVHYAKTLEEHNENKRKHLR